MSPDDLAALHAATVRELSQAHPMIARGLLDLGARPELAPAALRALAFFVRHRGVDALPQGGQALAHVSFDFLRLQARFLRTGRYRASDPSRFREALYEDAEKMRGYYLDGLMLSYAFWPNHAAMFGHFTRVFGALPDGTRIAEIGPGHALMASALMSGRPANRYIGIDLSPYSLERTQATLARDGVSPDRIQLLRGDATSERSFLDSGAEVALCCEVLEHVHEPRALLTALHRVLGGGQRAARAYITTVANLEAEDHVYLYRNADEIRAHLAETGFRVLDECVLRVDEAGNDEIIPLNYAAVIEPAGRNEWTP